MSATWEPAPREIRTLQNVHWDFSGQVVLITGAAQGQGRSHAVTFAAAGADLVICDLPAGTRMAGINYDLGNPEKLAAVADECRRLGSTVLDVTCDVRDSAQVQQLVAAAIAEFGRIDVLVNNAGLSGHHEVVDLPEQEWDDLVNTNLRGVFLCSKYAAREMIKARRGKIINTASVLAFAAVPASPHYTVAKHGVAGLTKAMAIELAPYGISVNYVCPSAVNTEMAKIVFADHVPENYAERLAATSGSWNLFDADQAPLDPSEVSYAVLFLASDAAKYVTGAPLLVDGGFMTK